MGMFRCTQRAEVRRKQKIEQRDLPMLKQIVELLLRAKANIYTMQIEDNYIAWRGAVNSHIVLSNKHLHLINKYDVDVVTQYLKDLADSISDGRQCMQKMKQKNS